MQTGVRLILLPDPNPNKAAYMMTNGRIIGEPDGSKAAGSHNPTVVVSETTNMAIMELNLPSLSETKPGNARPKVLPICRIVIRRKGKLEVVEAILAETEKLAIYVIGRKSPHSVKNVPRVAKVKAG